MRLFSTAFKRTIFAALGLFVLRLPVAVALPPRPDLEEDLLPERDALIRRIAHGENIELNIKSFSKLLEERKRRLGEAQGGVLVDEVNRRLQKTQEAGLDYVVGEHCTLSPDPKNLPHGHAFMAADWGKVISKEVISIKAASPYDLDKQLTMYRVQGLRQLYTLQWPGPNYMYEKPFIASVGDLVLVCWAAYSGNEGSGSAYPPEYRNGRLSQGFAARIKELPRIAAQTGMDLVHDVGGKSIRIAITSGKWTYNEKLPVLARLMVKRQLEGAGVGNEQRYLVLADKSELIVEVPPKLKNRDLMQPYHYVWMTLENPRIDRERRSWILTAVDLQPHYVIPAD